MESRTVTIIIPAYNEEKGLPGCLDALLPTAEARGWEVLVVDDGSTDGTPGIASEKGVRLISHPYNKGYGAALKTGIRNASGEIVVTLDADGQHDPDNIEKLLTYTDSYEMIVGSRVNQRGIRMPGKKALSMVANFLSGVKIPDLNSGFRAFRKETVMEFLHFCPSGFSFTTTVTLAYFRAGYSIKYIPIETERRVGRASNVRFFHDGYKTFLLIIRVIVLFNPLKVFMPASLVLFAVGVIFTIYGIVAFGRAPNTGILTILSSIILFFMGILADQISAIRRENRRDV